MKLFFTFLALVVIQSTSAKAGEPICVCYDKKMEEHTANNNAEAKRSPAHCEQECKTTLGNNYEDFFWQSGRM